MFNYNLMPVMSQLRPISQVMHSTDWGAALMWLNQHGI